MTYPAKSWESPTIFIRLNALIFSKGLSIYGITTSSISEKKEHNKVGKLQFEKWRINS